MSREFDYLSIIEQALSNARDNNFVSYDISDIRKSSIIRYCKNIDIKLIRNLTMLPLGLISKYRPEWIRFFVKEKGYIYPQAQAHIIRALLKLQKSHITSVEDELLSIVDWLIDARNNDYKNFGWGQPFIWYSDIIFPKNTPRATVSSQVAWAMLDLYEYSKRDKYLEVAVDVCELFINNFLHHTDDEHGSYFSYTSLDDFKIHNSNILAASVLARVYKYTGNERYHDISAKTALFTVNDQNDDGSFCYWAKSENKPCVIDNYHSGFVLEALASIKDDLEDTTFLHAYERGITYFRNNLIQDGMPKMTNHSLYPIDIQSCAQSIITLSGHEEDKQSKKLARDVADYAIGNLYLPEHKHFAYRKYANGFLDKSYYFRWGDSWMIRALAEII